MGLALALCLIAVTPATAETPGRDTNLDCGPLSSPVAPESASLATYGYTNCSNAERVMRRYLTAVRTIPDTCRKRNGCRPKRIGQWRCAVYLHRGSLAHCVRRGRAFTGPDSYPSFTLIR